MADQGLGQILELLQGLEAPQGPDPRMVALLQAVQGLGTGPQTLQTAPGRQVQLPGQVFQRAVAPGLQAIAARGVAGAAGEQDRFKQQLALLGAQADITGKIGSQDLQAQSLAERIRAAQMSEDLQRQRIEQDQQAQAAADRRSQALLADRQKDRAAKDRRDRRARRDARRAEKLRAKEPFNFIGNQLVLRDGTVKEIPQDTDALTRKLLKQLSDHDRSGDEIFGQLKGEEQTFGEGGEVTIRSVGIPKVAEEGRRNHRATRNALVAQIQQLNPAVARSLDLHLQVEKPPPAAKKGGAVKFTMENGQVVPVVEPSEVVELRGAKERELQRTILEGISQTGQDTLTGPPEQDQSIELARLLASLPGSPAGATDATTPSTSPTPATSNEIIRRVLDDPGSLAFQRVLNRKAGEDQKSAAFNEAVFDLLSRIRDIPDSLDRAARGRRSTSASSPFDR